MLTAPGITVADFTQSQLAIAVADQIIGAATLGSNLSYDSASQTINSVNTGGTLTSLALVLPSSILTVSGSPATGSAATISAALASAAANLFLASPSGASGSLSLRAIAAVDVPNLSAAKITSGTMSASVGGTGATIIGNTLAVTGTTLDVAGANVTGINAANIATGTLAAARGGTGVSNTGTITLGGNLVTSGAFNATLTLTALTNVTLPTTGTLCVTTGSASIVTVGTIATGTWQGSLVTGTYGGTGVNNGANTITLGGSLVTSGANALTLTTTGATNVTLPTSGTLSTTTGTVTSVGITGSTFLFVNSPITSSGSIGISVQPTASISLASITATGSSTLAATALTGLLSGGTINTGAITSSALTSGVMTMATTSGLLRDATGLVMVPSVSLTLTGGSTDPTFAATATATNLVPLFRATNSSGVSCEIGKFGSTRGTVGAITSIDGYIYNTSGSFVIAATVGPIKFAVGGGTPLVAAISSAGLLAIGVAAVLKGSISLAGNISGNVGIQPAAAAGTHTITLPTLTGNNGTVPVTDGTGIWTMGRAGLFASATLDFPSILAGLTADLTITVTGAAVNDPISPGWPAGLDANFDWVMFVSSANTVTVRARNMLAIAGDPASATYGALVAKA